MTDNDPFSQPGRFERAIRKVLRPLVRALIAQNVTVRALYRVVKQSYVEVAEEILGDDATDSRISIMTGVHRRDVREFRTLPDDDTEGQRRKLSTLSTVVGRWMSNADYTDPDGQPIAIPRSAETGPSFDALVQSVSRDIRPRTVLDELARQGIVTTEDDSVHLVLDGLVGPADMDQRLHFFSHNLGDHMSAAVDNILAEDPAHLERAVFYNALTDDALHRIETDVRDVATDALRQINKTAAGLQSEDATDPTATNRFRFGVFFYKETERPKTKGQDPNEDR
ncbi:DUF6502 family protein [uncultured Roseobacter sp.]|uniref:DUF6502 family protein n=1 Tax=uncultured Roseobacter sp. TaxID=114847 RepID=UPI002638DF93|nr:DUF6502 family protein [uncultured Roseobacter sp.]